MKPGIYYDKVDECIVKITHYDIQTGRWVGKVMNPEVLSEDSQQLYSQGIFYGEYTKRDLVIANSTLSRIYYNLPRQMNETIEETNDDQT